MQTYEAVAGDVALSVAGLALFAVAIAFGTPHVARYGGAPPAALRVS